MIRTNIQDMIIPNAPMITMLHQSEITKVFSLYLEEGKTKDCGCAEPPEAIFQTVEGTGTIYLGEEALAVAEGDVVICPAGVPHRLEANRGSAFRLLVVRPLRQ